MFAYQLSVRPIASFVGLTLVSVHFFLIYFLFLCIICETHETAVATGLTNYNTHFFFLIQYHNQVNVRIMLNTFLILLLPQYGN